MPRLIDADTVVTVQTYDDEHEEWGEETLTIADALDKWADEGCPPTIDAEPVRHGRWEWHEDWGQWHWEEPPDCISAGWRCSSCKTDLAECITQHCPGENVYLDSEDRIPTLPRCPHCGAKMDGGAENARNSISR